MKDPDSMYDAVSEAAEAEIDELPLDEDEKESVLEVRKEKYAEIVGRFFEYGEYLTIEVDTDREKARIMDKWDLEELRKGNA